MPPKRNQPRSKTLRSWQFVFVQISVASQHGLLRHQVLNIDPEPFSDSASISRVRHQKVANLFFLNALRRFPKLPTILLINRFFASGFIRRNRFPGWV